MKREPRVWENTFANDISEKDLVSKIYIDKFERAQTNFFKKAFHVLAKPLYAW